jgi:type VI secretion system protein ImpC
VSNLPRYSGAGAVVGPTERRISDALEAALAQAGFLPLVDDPRTASAAFYSDNSTHRPREFSDERATEAERSDAKLSSVLTLTRFAQLMKIMMRDKIGGCFTADEVEIWLNAWLQQYVAPRSGHESPASAETPLLDARVSVRFVQGLKGAYDIELFLRPGYQFSPPRDLRISARLMESGSTRIWD